MTSIATRAITVERLSAIDPQVIWRRVEKAEGCWLWTGHIGPQGYGSVNVCAGRLYAHRAVYMLTKGAIPEGYQIDHLCHTWDDACDDGDDCMHRRCVNPDHLEAVTPGVNSRRAAPARRTHCPSGHEYTPENTRVNNGKRHCRTCSRDRNRERVARLRAAPAETSRTEGRGA